MKFYNNKFLISTLLGFAIYSITGCSSTLECQRMLESEQVDIHRDIEASYDLPIWGSKANYDKYGVFVYPDKITFNTDGAIKFAGFANGKYSCKHNGLFFAILANLYKALKHGDIHYLEAFNQHYFDKIEWASRYQEEFINPLDVQISKTKNRFSDIINEKGNLVEISNEDRKKHLLRSVEYISYYKNNPEEEKKLLECIDKLYEEVYDLIKVNGELYEEKYDSLKEKLEKLKEKYEETNEEVMTIEEKIKEMEYEIADKRQKIKNQNVHIYWDDESPGLLKKAIAKEQFKTLNFTTAATYEAIKRLTPLDTDYSSFDHLKIMFAYYPTKEEYYLNIRETLTGLYVHEFFVKPFLKQQSSLVKVYEGYTEKDLSAKRKMSSKNLNTSELTSLPYTAMMENIASLKLLFYIKYLEFLADNGTTRGLHHYAILKDDALSIEDTCLVARIFSKIVGHDYASPENIHIRLEGESKFESLRPTSNKLIN